MEKWRQAVSVLARSFGLERAISEEDDSIANFLFAFGILWEVVNGLLRTRS